MIGVVLAGGTGSRLAPLTRAVNKHLLAVYDQPMIYYPLSTLRRLGIKRVVLVTDEASLAAFQSLLDDGRDFGVDLRYAIQDRPGGLAHAVLTAEHEIQESPFTVALGDNILLGKSLDLALSRLKQSTISGAIVFAKQVADASSFGVVQFDESDQITSLDEKPEQAENAWCIPGLYAYDNTAFDRIRDLRPSLRNELEITDLNKSYLAEGRLRVIRLDHSIEWFDCGTPDDLLKAGNAAADAARRQEVYGFSTLHSC